MRLSSQLLSLVAGTAVITTAGALALGCTESRAAAEAPAIVPITGPALPAMRPIDFEAPPVPVVVATPPVVVIESAQVAPPVETVVESEPIEPVRHARRMPRRNVDPAITSVPVPVDEPFGSIGVGPGHWDQVAPNCGRG